MFLCRYQGLMAQATRLSENLAHVQRSVQNPAKVVPWTELSEIRAYPFRLGQAYAGNTLLGIEETTLKWDSCTTHHSGAPHIQPWVVGDSVYVGDKKFTIGAISGDTAILRSPTRVISHPLTILRQKAKIFCDSGEA